MSQSNNNNTNPLLLNVIQIPPTPPFVMITLKKNTEVLPKSQNIEDDLRDFVRYIIGDLIADKKGFIFCYKHLIPVLQDGPNCGLAALSMVSSCKKELIKLKDIFNYTKSKGFSNNGEMFSVHYMAEIARALLGCNVTILEDGIRNKEMIINEILHGGLLLIPYDADRNHSPCKKKGHRAHWAVVCGLILEGLPPARMLDQEDCMTTKANSIQCLPGTQNITLAYIPQAYVPDKVYMLARQGKSLHPAVWKYDDLKDSNENLIEFDPSKAESELDYILPPEGVEGGLKGKALIIKGLPKTTFEELGNHLSILKSFL